jgi:hypothetical protein
MALNVPTHAEVVEELGAFFARHPKVAPTRLGREATGEPNLIKEIRGGRTPSLETLSRLVRAMAVYDGETKGDENTPRPFSLTSSPPGGEVPSSSESRLLTRTLDTSQAAS